MLVVIAVIGLLVLGGLAVWVGLIEGDALDRAWRRVASARQGLTQRETLLVDRELKLDEREREVELREAIVRRWERRLGDQQGE
jgi:hypothetical protein